MFQARGFAEKFLNRLLLLWLTGTNVYLEQFQTYMIQLEKSKLFSTSFRCFHRMTYVQKILT